MIYLYLCIYLLISFCVIPSFNVYRCYILQDMRCYLSIQVSVINYITVLLIVLFFFFFYLILSHQIQEQFYFLLWLMPILWLQNEDIVDCCNAAIPPPTILLLLTPSSKPFPTALLIGSPANFTVFCFSSLLSYVEHLTLVSLQLPMAWICGES